MTDAFGDIRREYEAIGLRRSHLEAEPIEQFRRWLDAAVAAGVPEPNAMILATAEADGRPAARAVLLKGFDADGFVFFTNMASRKGRELEANPRAALCFVWLPIHRQVRIEGRAEVVDDRAADEYFLSRPPGARLAAAASPQSEVLRDRVELEDRYATLAAEFPQGEVPRPLRWTGVRVVPDAVEFWQGRLHRLHDRFRYSRGSDGWRLDRLAP